MVDDEQRNIIVAIVSMSIDGLGMILKCCLPKQKNKQEKTPDSKRGAPNVGIEPTTTRLRVVRSTD